MSSAETGHSRGSTTTTTTTAPPAASVPSGQLSLFGADVLPTRPVDLEGLLAGPGQVVRLGGTARISVVVDQEWRARALLAEFARRGLTGSGATTDEHTGATDEPAGVATEAPAGELTDESAAQRTGAGSGNAAVAGHIGVRTAFSACLAPVASRWLRGALTLPPDGFQLDGPMLRMWFIAAGQVHTPGRSGSPRAAREGPTQAVTLRLSATDEAAWLAVEAALARTGLPAELVGPRAGGPAYRIVGRRRIARFAELIGTRPEAAPAEAWPRTAAPATRVGGASAVSSPIVAGSGVPVITVR